jgi:hypothetical protein
MNLDLTALFPDLEALTPEGRWNMLQKWLKENPEYGERAERWSTQTVKQVFDEIRDLTAQKYGPLATIVLGSVAIESRLRATIEVLQACYRERATYDNQQLEKEIKHARPHKRIGKQNRKRV